MSRIGVLSCLALSGAVWACSETVPGGPTLSGGNPGESASGATDGPQTDGAAPNADDESDGGPDGTGGDSDAEVKFDVRTTDLPTSGDGCQKVDLLFVIDNSVSMLDEQSNLVDSFPAFIDSIQTALPQVDQYHVGVIASSRYPNNPKACRAYGALVTQTSTACGPFAQGNYITSADELEADFRCVAQVGSEGGYDERPMQSLVAAVDGSLGGSSGCNAGFLRDDALLVVVVITDEEDDWEYFEPGDAEKWQGSDGNPPDWYQAVVEAKGAETNAVILAIVGGVQGNACPAWDGQRGAEDAPRLRSFASMFTYHQISDVCEPNYGPAFAEAIATIDTACDDFRPEG